MRPVRKSAQTLSFPRAEGQDVSLTLGMKHFPRPGAQPVLFIHGLAQNDRLWDPALPEYSFARFLHAQGYDVWVGNMRAAGTSGFRSETPPGPHHWSVEDYAVYDVPALIRTVRTKTGQAPFVIGHSLAAWAFEGYLAGLQYAPDGAARPNARAATANQDQIRGMITIAGVYNLWWPFAAYEALEKPIRTERDFYQSNYELELMSDADVFYPIVPQLPGLPLGWIGNVLNLPLEQIPYIGSRLQTLYQGFQNRLVATPILSMFYYHPNVDEEMVRLHGHDGLEDLGPHLIEQLTNAIKDQQTHSYYHMERPANAYEYWRGRRNVRVPMLFVGGARDRLANVEMIYQDGYLQNKSPDKQFLAVEKAGHLDILSGKNAAREVMGPVLEWIRAR